MYSQPSRPPRPFSPSSSKLGQAYCSRSMLMENPLAAAGKEGGRRLAQPLTSGSPGELPQACPAACMYICHLMPLPSTPLDIIMPLVSFGCSCIQAAAAATAPALQPQRWAGPLRHGPPAAWVRRSTRSAPSSGRRCSTEASQIARSPWCVSSGQPSIWSSCAQDDCSTAIKAQHCHWSAAMPSELRMLS